MVRRKGTFTSSFVGGLGAGLGFRVAHELLKPPSARQLHKLADAQLVRNIQLRLRLAIWEYRTSYGSCLTPEQAASINSALGNERLKEINGELARITECLILYQELGSLTSKKKEQLVIAASKVEGFMRSHHGTSPLLSLISVEAVKLHRSTIAFWTAIISGSLLIAVGMSNGDRSRVVIGFLFIALSIIIYFKSRKWSALRQEMDASIVERLAEPPKVRRQFLVLKKQLAAKS